MALTTYEYKEKLIRDLEEEISDLEDEKPSNEKEFIEISKELDMLKVKLLKIEDTPAIELLRQKY